MNIVNKRGCLKIESNFYCETAFSIQKNKRWIPKNPPFVYNILYD